MRAQRIAVMISMLNVVSLVFVSEIMRANGKGKRYRRIRRRV